MSNICIIPARAGSKRIVKKNIKPFMGKPIMAYSIEAALNSGLFDVVMVSTDSEEFAKVARLYGAEVPFMRSAETANDFASTADVINEVLDNYQNQNRSFDIVSCIYSTAPFVTPERLREAYSLIKNDIDSSFAAVAYSYPVQRSLRMKENRIFMAYPEYVNSRSQDLEPFYHDAGQFYFSTVEAFRKNNDFWGDNTTAVILSDLEVQDLDTQTDWELAELKFQRLHR